MKKMLLKTLVTGLALVFGSVNAQASITQISRLDTAPQLTVVWSWVGTGSALDSATYWSDSVSISDIPSQWQVSYGFDHLIGPHPGVDVNANPNSGGGVGSFSPSATGIVFSDSGSILHPADPLHHDSWTFTVNQSAPGSGTMTLNVVHAVPEPGTIMLLGIGGLGIFGMKYSKRRESEVA